MNEAIIAELKLRKELRPFERFIVTLNDGRSLPVEGRFRFAFNLNEALVIDDNDAISHFSLHQVKKIESLAPPH